MPKICIINLVFKFISLRHDAIFHLLCFVNADCSVSRTELLVTSFLILYTYSYILLLRLIKFCDCLPRNPNLKEIEPFEERYLQQRHRLPTVAMNFLLSIPCTGFANRCNARNMNSLMQKTVIKHIYSDSRKIFQQKHNNII